MIRARTLAAASALALSSLAVAAPWQNPANPLDVDEDGAVSPRDALVCIQSLNRDGARALPAPSGTSTPPPFLDVNGDDHATPVDALLVINHLNGGGAGGAPTETGEVTVRVTDPSGSPRTSFLPGEELLLEVWVHDPRATPAGVFSAYLDVVYDAEHLALVVPPTPGPELVDVVQSDATLPGRVRDLGGTGPAAPTLSPDVLVGTLRLAVSPTAPGAVTPEVQLTPGSLAAQYYLQDDPFTLTGAVCPDADDDGTCDASDACVGDDLTGDADLDGVCADLDLCPLEPSLTAPGPCGCLADGDADDDGVCDVDDTCPAGDDRLDDDGDGVPDACDLCLLDDAFGDADASGICDLALTASAMSPGQPGAFEVRNAAPGAVVAFFVSTRGPGAGPCAPQFGVCVDLRQPTLIGTAQAGGDGAARLDLTVPRSATPGMALWFQAVWGSAATGTGETSPVLTDTVRP